VHGVRVPAAGRPPETLLQGEQLLANRHERIVDKPLNSA
jgi:hypothetical protein